MPTTVFTRETETRPLEAGGFRVDREGRATGKVSSLQGALGWESRLFFPGRSDGLRRVLHTDLMKSLGFPEETLASRQAPLLMKNSA